MKVARFVGLLSALAALPAFAEENGAAVVQDAAAAGSGAGNAAYFAIAAGLAIGIAAFGGAFGQAKIGAAALDGIARNPQAGKQMFVPMILGLVLIESLVIYALVVAFVLTTKV